MIESRCPVRRSSSLLLVSCLAVLPLAGCALSGGPHIFRVESHPQDWSSVATIAPGNTIKVTLERGQPLTRNFVVADESELIALNVIGSPLPRPVTRRLRTLASDQPNELLRASHGQTVTEGRVRIGPDGVFLDGEKIAALNQVLEQLPRNRVAEVSRIHRATGRGFLWGTLIGGGVGLAVTLGACGTNWSQETNSCSNLTPMWVAIGPLWGSLIGTAVGASTNASTVVYKKP